MNRRDAELLSAYLDGELKPSEISRLESRLRSDPELASVLNDLRATRTLLRRLPTRKAPRNFTLTRKMVGQNPPLPRAYPVFRFATTIATLLFFFTFGLNFVGSQLAASQAMPYGMGGGGGDEFESYAAEPALEMPADAPAMEAPMAPAAEPAAPAEEPVPAESATAPDNGASLTLAPASPEVPLVEDTTRIMETPAAKNGETENAVAQGQPSAADEALVPVESPSPAPLISSTWQIVLAIVALVGLVMMGVMRQSSARRWK